ncbi:MAG: NAD-dependent epimerase/dehydratase family protein [Desulfuromonadaceae bacterium]
MNLLRRTTISILITGVAGFIGCNLAELLIKQGHTVFGVDNFCRGNLNNISEVLGNPAFQFGLVDMTDLATFQKVFEDMYSREQITEVWHLAANSDIPAGVSDANIDLRDTFMTTFNTLEIMKDFGVRKMMFASSSAVYGDWEDRPLIENSGPLLPISNYGAMKLASEACISAATESFLQQSFIFRFPNVIGIPATHGVILDFVRKLKITPQNLDVLGNGTQQKGYLHVEELIGAMLHLKDHANEKVAVYNIGADDEGVTVRFIAEEVVRIVAPEASITYGSDNKGWVGDVPRFVYSTEKLRELGWSAKLNSKNAISKAVYQIASQEGFTL